MRRAHYADQHRQHERFYWVPDPWNMRSAREQYRFRETNTLIEQNFGRLETILEIGCGEGHQSQYLSRLCNRHIGVDVSARAVGRARRLLPKSEFHTGDVFNGPSPTGEFAELVTAFEVLYFVSDPSRAVDTLSKLGAACMVSVYAGESDRLAPYLQRFAGLKQQTIRLDDVEWSVFWWRN